MRRDAVALKKERTQGIQTMSEMQSKVQAATECHSRSQDPGRGRFSIGFTLIFWVLFLRFAKPFQYSYILVPTTNSHDREEATATQHAQVEQREQGWKPTGLGWWS